ncbi:MAG: hypothetical protein GF334_03330 [Candidatus Altiarchaeales archaeon]|nr:hypothetical protein [Candidatus Altiarchaeales archaeon]
MVTRSTAYRLRASQPTPVSNTCETSVAAQPGTIAGFILQTFKAEKITTDTCEDKAQILCSTDMRGLGGNYTSASYSAQRFLDPDTGGIVFQASEVFAEEIIEEDDVPGAANL